MRGPLSSDDEVKLLHAAKLAAASAYRAALDELAEGDGYGDEYCAALAAEAHAAHTRYHQALSSPTIGFDLPSHPVSTSAQQTMKIAIRSPFPVTSIPSDGGTITTRVIFGASYCEARTDRGIVSVSHPAGDFQLTTEKFQLLLRQGNLAMIGE